MSSSRSNEREDEVLLRMLKTPPTPHASLKAKPKPSRPPKSGKKAQKPTDSRG